MVAEMRAIPPTRVVAATAIAGADAVVVMAQMRGSEVTQATLWWAATSQPVVLTPSAVAVVAGAGRVQALRRVPRAARRARHRCQTSINTFGVQQGNALF